MIGHSREGRLWDDLLSLVTALAMSGIMVMFRQYPMAPSLPTAIAACGRATVTCLFLLRDYTKPCTQLPILMAFGLVSSAVGTAFFLLGSRLLRPVETAILSTLETPLAPMWVWRFRGETPGPATVIGGGIVMAAVIWHTLQSAWAAWPCCNAAIRPRQGNPP